MNRHLIVVFFALVAGYGLIEAWPLLAGPSLTLTSPENYAVSDDGVVTVSGTAKRTSSIVLNGTPLLPDQEGAFLKTLAFAKGASILTFVATDRFGRTITHTRTIFVP